MNKMSKGLEYIRDISCLISEYYSDKEPLTEEQKLSKNCFLDYCKYIAKELDSLEQIDNAKPSEALECLEKVKNYKIKNDIKEGWYEYILLYEEMQEELDTIKQTLIKAQEQEKVLEIIKKKKVNIDLLYASSSVEQYNDELVRVYGYVFSEGRLLLKDEFDLLKRWLEQ